MALLWFFNPKITNPVELLVCCLTTNNILVNSCPSLASFHFCYKIKAVRWMPMEKWDKCAFATNEDDLEGRVCYGGLDLSSTTDITALINFVKM